MIFLRKALVWLLIVGQILLPLEIRAAEGDPEWKKSAEAGANFGREAILNPPRPQAPDADGIIQMGTDKNGNPISIDTKVFKGATTNAYTNAPTLDKEKMQNYLQSGDPAGMIVEAQLGLQGMYQDSQQANPSRMGGVYQTLLEAKNYDKPDLREEPFLQPTKQWYKDFDLENNGFADCGRTTEWEATPGDGHIPNLVYCNEYKAKARSCDIYQQLSSNGIIEADGHPANIAMCPDDENCILGWIGDFSRNYGGSCTTYEEEVSYRILDPSRIQSAVIDFARYDDYFEISSVNTTTGQTNILFRGPIKGTRSYEGGTYNGPENVWPGEDPVACELGQSWYNQNLGIDITQAFKNVQPGTVVKFKSRVSVDGGGEAYARFRIKHTPFDANANQSYAGTPTESISQIYNVPPDQNELVLTNLPPDMNQFNLAVIDTDGLISEFTAPISKETTPLDSTVHMVWNTPTQRVDNSELKPEEIAGYRIEHRKGTASCLQSAQLIASGSSAGTLSCTDYYPILDYGCTPRPGQPGAMDCGPGKNAKTCTDVNGEYICSNYMNPWPIDGIEPLCRKVEVRPEVPLPEGETCVTDEQGEQTCGQPIEFPEPNRCKQFEQDPKCSFIEQVCQEGEGPNGECDVLKKTYDCGYDTTYTDYSGTTTYACAGEFRCLGEECVDIPDGDESSFAETAAMMSAVNYITQDLDCKEATTEQNVDCQVFKGQAYECREAFQGLQDCCINPKETNMADYMKAGFAIGILRSNLEWASELQRLPEGPQVVIDNLQGISQAIDNGVADAFTWVQGAFTPSAESMVGQVVLPAYDAVGVAWDAATYPFEMFTWYKDIVMDQLEKWTVDMITKIGTNMGASAASAAASGGVADQAAVEAGNQAGQEAAQEVAKETAKEILKTSQAYFAAFMTVVSVASIAYMAVQFIYACKQPELELSSKRGIGSCAYIGTYCSERLPPNPVTLIGLCTVYSQSWCCYNSPLSRILMTQIRQQPGFGGMGTPENPNCGGIPLGDIEKVDWDAIDLREWKDVMMETGALKNPSEWGMDRIAGEDSYLGGPDSAKKPVQDPIERLQTKIDKNQDYDEFRMRAEDQAPVFDGSN